MPVLIHVFTYHSAQALRIWKCGMASGTEFNRSQSSHLAGWAALLTSVSVLKARRQAATWQRCSRQPITEGQGMVPCSAVGPALTQLIMRDGLRRHPDHVALQPETRFLQWQALGTFHPDGPYNSYHTHTHTHTLPLLSFLHFPSTWKSPVSETPKPVLSATPLSWPVLACRPSSPTPFTIHRP